MSKTNQAKIENENKSTDELIQEYIDNGGKITVCEPCVRSEVVEYKRGFWGRPGKKKST